MPFKLVGKVVKKQEPDGQWVIVKRHETREKALAHLRALIINVKDAGKKGKHGCNQR